MDFGTLRRLNEIEERIAALEAAVQVLQERSGSAEAVKEIADQVASLADAVDGLTKSTRRTLTLGYRKDGGDAGKADQIGAQAPANS